MESSSFENIVLGGKVKYLLSANYNITKMELLFSVTSDLDNKRMENKIKINNIISFKCSNSSNETDYIQGILGIIETKTLNKVKIVITTDDSELEFMVDDKYKIEVI